jgi:hypothetical protein
MTEDAADPRHSQSQRLPPYLAGGDESVADPVVAASEVSPLRPFVLTSGRVEPVDETLEMEAQVVAANFSAASYQHLAYERRDIVALCRTPMSVVEVAAKLQLQVGVVRVLVADLVAAGYLAVERPSAQLSQDLDLIERVIRGVEAIL